MTTGNLKHIANSHPQDFELLELILTILPPRRQDTARDLEQEIRAHLARRPAVKNTKSTSGKRFTVAAAAVFAIVTLATGILQGAGAEIWKRAWPKIEQLYKIGGRGMG